ncbi:MAG: class I SAM-dependent methyltransferase [Alphaproteobacteria bacterium]|nr:class I SAM-dependent methyltransferase [Alphaproteobacteria bacterium]
MSIFLVYFYLVIFVVFDIVILSYGIEQIVRIIRKLPPPVPSAKKLRNAVVQEIRSEFPNAKTILDIGSGWGGMTRKISRHFPGVSVTGIELMPTPYIYSVVAGVFFKNVKYVFGDAFKFLENKKFDIGVAYLLTRTMPEVEKYLSNFNLLLVLDFPLPNTTPYKIIKLHKDFLGQHRLYVYKNK